MRIKAQSARNRLCKLIKVITQEQWIRSRHANNGYTHIPELIGFCLDPGRRYIGCRDVDVYEKYPNVEDFKSEVFRSTGFSETEEAEELNELDEGSEGKPIGTMFLKRLLEKMIGVSGIDTEYSLQKYTAV